MEGESERGKERGKGLCSGRKGGFDCMSQLRGKEGTKVAPEGD